MSDDLVLERMCTDCRATDKRPLTRYRQMTMAGGVMVWSDTPYFLQRCTLCGNEWLVHEETAHRRMFRHAS